MSKTKESRRHPRFRHRCHAKLTATGQGWEAHLINISAQGALVAIIDPHMLNEEDEIELTIGAAEDNNEIIEMVGKVAHVKDHYVGVDGKAKTENDFAKLQYTIKALSNIDYLTGAKSHPRPHSTWLQQPLPCRLHFPPSVHCPGEL